MFVVDSELVLGFLGVRWVKPEKERTRRRWTNCRLHYHKFADDYPPLLNITTTAALGLILDHSPSTSDAFSFSCMRNKRYSERGRRGEKSIWSGFSVSSGSLLKMKVTNGCSCSGSWHRSSQLFQNKQRRQPSQSLHSAPNSPFNYFAICPLSTFYQWDVYGADRLNPTHVKHG